MMKLLIFFFLQGLLFSQGLILNQENNLQFSDSVKTAHFNIYYYKSSYAEQHIKSIIREREDSYERLTAFFNTSSSDRVNLYLFPDEQMKYEATGHKGYGWGTGNNIIEVMNDTIRIDPYHELVHIICYNLGKPTALFDEGLAVHLSEKLGSNYFTSLLGYPGKTVDQVFRIFITKKSPIDMVELFRYESISDSKDVPLAYIQSADFVSYILDKYGKYKLLNLINELITGNHIHNEEAFKKIYEHSFQEISQYWLKEKS